LIRRLILISAALFTVLAPVFAAPRMTHTHTTRYFEVYSDGKDPYIAKLLAQTAESELLRISERLGYDPPKDRRFPLLVYSTHLGFINAGGLKERKFTVGLASMGNETISVDASGAFALPSQVLSHEITHVVVFRILGRYAPDIPLWIAEGLAKCLSDDYGATERETVADAAGNGSLIPLRYLRRSFPEDRVNLAYSQSASAIHYLVEENGHRAPRRLLQKMRDTGDIDEAMEFASGFGLDAFEQMWIDHAEREYRSLRVFRTITQAVGIVMAILAVLAFAARRRQKIEAARRWEAEELEQARLREQLYEQDEPNPYRPEP